MFHQQQVQNLAAHITGTLCTSIINPASVDKPVTGCPMRLTSVEVCDATTPLSSNTAGPEKRDGKQNEYKR